MSGTGVEAADTLFVNGTIWTGDAQQPWAQSMAVANGRIVSLGNASEVQVGAHGVQFKYCPWGGFPTFVPFLSSLRHMYLWVVFLPDWADCGNWSQYRDCGLGGQFCDSRSH